MKNQSSTTGNPLIDAWWQGSEQALRAQSDWLSSLSSMNSSADVSEFLDGAKESWEKCEQQYQAWLSAMQEWSTYESFSADVEGSYDKSLDALKLLLNPKTFFNSGINELDQVFKRLLETPDFADFGVFEKKFMHISKDWYAMREASTEYQTVIFKTWSEAFNLFTAEFSEKQKDSPPQPKEALEQWLNTANDFLVNMQRSDEFLNAQRKLVNASTEYKLRQKNIVEEYCEALSIPTRSEVDDLHHTVYQLRREVRTLKRQLTDKVTDKKMTKKPPVTRVKNMKNYVKTDSKKPEKAS